jgi:hypothetical protein
LKGLAMMFIQKSLPMRQSLSRWRSLLGLAVVAGIAGCSSSSGAPPSVKVYEVKGKVLLPNDKPLNGGHIYFVPKDGAMTSEGKISPDGSFSLSTGNSGEGAPPGEFRVRVEPDDPALLAANRPGRAGKTLPFPARYLDEDTSGLVFTLKPQANQLEPIRLK